MPSCVVIGGGLAGMVVARELASRGWSVTLLERSQRLGGKAGADVREGRHLEHGYHVFPTWYPNVRALLRDLGVKLVDFDRYHYVRPGEFPKFVTLRGPSSLGALLHNTFRGILPWYQMALFFYFVLDMLSRPLTQKRLLDRVSQVGLMRQAWYITEAVAEISQENILKASAIPIYEMSAMTAKHVAGYWLRQASPFLSVLPGDLQTTFIAPLERTLRALNISVRLGVEALGLRVESGRIVAVRARGSDGTEADVKGDIFVVCTPFEVTRRWLTDGLYALDPELGNIHHLEAQPMAALHLRLKHKLAGLPREHVFLHGGRYALSFIDVSGIWGGLPHSELSFISSNYSPISALSEHDAANELLGEIREYLPITDADIEGWDLRPNIEVPLFIKTIGAWPNRPRPHSAIPNLYFAGDYVKNDIDLACMEGTVFSAIQAAAAVLRSQSPSNVPAAAVPSTWPRALLVAARWGLLPVVIPVWLIARIAEALGAGAPTYSETMLRATPRLRRGNRMGS